MKTRYVIKYFIDELYLRKRILKNQKVAKAFAQLNNGVITERKVVLTMPEYRKMNVTNFKPQNK